MHDRSDYKHGWQLEQEWNEQSYGTVDNNSQRYLVRNKSSGRTSSGGWKEFSSQNRGHFHHHEADSEDEEQVKFV